MDTLLDEGESLVHLPPVTDAESGEVVARLNDILDALANLADETDEVDAVVSIGHVESLGLIVPFFESLLEGSFDDISLAAYAQLIHMVEYPAIPDLIVVQAAFGRRAGEETIRDLERTCARARQKNRSVDGYIDDLAETERLASNRTARKFGGEVRRLPDDERTRLAIRILRRATSLAPPELRTHLLCAIGWLQWARGRRPVALTYLAEAQRTGSGCPLPVAMTALVSSRRPRWCA
ncbi:hypothetical protein [Microbacterium suaedae]|uniref:hypothetical protein n=1 Tax=Microbacterium suaedae TaxID=2067813 RepID=UPI000DA247FB|nr:hypothetical protein [Microbacterium suaedae]